MNVYKWSEMSARERDALVAEKVMGYQGRKIVYAWGDRAKRERPKLIFTDGGRSIGNYDTWVDEQGLKIQYGRPHHVYFAPEYTTDISAAWEVVERLKSNGWNMDFLNAYVGYANFRVKTP